MRTKTEAPNLCSQRIQEARKRCKYTQKDLAIQLQLRGVATNQRKVSRVEGGQIVPALELPLYAEALNVTTDWLMGKE